MNKVKCETCIYRKNCQFLGKHKNAIVEECSAFESEMAIKNEVAKEIFEALDEYLKTWRTESIKRIKYDTTDYYKGKVCASDEMFWFLRNELKPKYMEEES